ncbi:MAG: hypothetical protein H0W84_00025 [Bacteroidetes bacterium]|nr:hypothetical protein [Bacteroidota bacterium]
MKKNNKDFYINTGFAVFIFVLTIAFLKEYVFQSASMLTSGFAGLIGAVLGFGLVWLLKSKGVFIKIVVLIIYVAIIATVAYINKKEVISNVHTVINVANSLKGNWVTSDNDLVLKLNITDKSMEMNFTPNNKQLIFEYEIEGKKVDFFNDKEEDSFQWEILKLTNDSLVVLEKEQVLRFKKEQ